MQKSQYGWEDGKEDVVPFIKYILGTVVSAYRDFDDRMEIVSENAGALETVRKAVFGIIGKFTKADVAKLCPSISNSSVESSLKKLRRKE